MNTISEVEIDRLRAFQRQADWLRNSKLLETGKVTFKTTVPLIGSESLFQFEGYDETAFLAVLPVLRQFILQKEPVNFNYIHNLLMAHCDRDDLKEWVKFSLKQWKATFAGLSTKNSVLFNQTASPEKAIQQVFYGYSGLFHVDLKMPANDRQTTVVLNAAMQQAFPVLWNSIRNIESVITIWLDNPSASVPPCPTD